jgi:hypothetical protein
MEDRGEHAISNHIMRVIVETKKSGSSPALIDYTPRMAKTMRTDTKEFIKEVDEKAEALKGKKKPKMAPAAKKEEEKKKSKILALKDYIKAVGDDEYQDYVDVLDNEVLYKSDDIKSIIKLAYKNKSPKEISDMENFVLDEVYTILWNWYIDSPATRENTDDPKPYKYEQEVKKKLEEMVM